MPMYIYICIRSIHFMCTLYTGKKYSLCIMTCAVIYISQTHVFPNVKLFC